MYEAADFEALKRSREESKSIIQQSLLMTTELVAQQPILSSAWKFEIDKEVLNQRLVIHQNST
jgi:hypothetical protein